MAERQNKQSLGPLLTGISGGAVAAILFKILQGEKAEAQDPTEPPTGDIIVHLDDEVMQLLAALVVTQQALLEAVQGITGGNGTTPPTCIVPNTNGVISFSITCPAALTAYQLPELPVPDDMALQLKADAANAGDILVAGQAHEAINPNAAWPLGANEAIGYRVDNCRRLWVAATTANDVVHCTVEQRIA